MSQFSSTKDSRLLESIGSRKRILFVILLLGTALRVYRLNSESIWHDEAVNVTIAQKGFSEMVSGIITYDNHPPLYYILLHFWMRLFGSSELSTRLLSAIFGILSIYMVYKVGEVSFGERVGLIAAFLLALFQFHIRYSQEARGYTLLLFLTITSFFFLLKALTRGELKYFAYYSFINILLIYTHPYGLFILMAQNVYFLLTWTKHKTLFRKWLAALGITITAFLPWILVFIKQFKGAGQSMWPTPTLISGIANLSFTVVGTFLRFIYFDPPYLTLATLAVLGILFVLELTDFSHLRALVRDNASQMLLLFTWFLIPIFVPFIISKLLLPIYNVRYMISCSVPLYLVIALIIIHLKKKIPVLVSLGLLGLVALLGLKTYYNTMDYHKEQWRQAVRYVETHARKEDLILLGTSHPRYFPIFPFNYYYKGTLPRFQVKSPFDEERVDSLLTSSTNGSRIWVVFVSYPPIVPGQAEEKSLTNLVEKHKKVSGLKILEEKKFNGLSRNDGGIKILLLEMHPDHGSLTSSQ